MNRKISKFGYEDTDVKIEIDLYGLIFEINKKVIEDKNIENIDEDDEDRVRKEIKDLIGEDSIKKINEKRRKDGYEDMTLDVEVAVLTCIYKTYINATSGSMIDELINTNKELENKVKENSLNRQQKRNYNRNYKNNYYKRNRRKY